MLVPKAAYPETVTVQRYLGRNAYGEDIYSDPVEHPARISYENKIVRDEVGEEVVSSSQVMLPAAAQGDINLGGRVTLPLDNTGARRVMSGGPVMGWRSVSHLQYDLQ